MDELDRDIRYAIRTLRQTPGVTLAAVLTLALGIGANVAMFSVVYGVLLRPLPYRDADQLLIVRAEEDNVGAHRPVPVAIQPTEFDTWQQPLDAVASRAFYTADDVVALSGDNGSEVIDSAVVSASFFLTLAGPFTAGRPLESRDDAAPSAVVSERLARRLFRDPGNAIGRELILSSHAYTVIGVVSGGFQFPNAHVDVWRPAGFVRSVNPRCCGFQLVVRAAPGVSVERVHAAVEPLFQAPANRSGASGRVIRASVVRLPDDLTSAARPALLVLVASVVMVLAVACSNLINLLLARNAARAGDFAVRRALGASTSRLVRQLLAETAVLAVVGTAGGAVMAQLGVSALVRLAGAAVPRADAIHMDWPVLLFAAGLGVLVTVGTGLIPALRVVHGPAMTTRGPGRVTTHAGTKRLQQALCVVQVALAVTLLVGATLLGRSLVRLLQVDLGVSTDHVLTASMNLAFGQRPSDAQVVARVDRVIEHVRSLPGVRAVGVGTSLPPTVSRMRVTLRRQDDSLPYQAAAIPATPGYFSVLRTRLIKGRFFTDADDSTHPPVMIMGEDTANRFFGDSDPLGRTMKLPVLRDGKNASTEMTLVGVIANVKYAGLGAPADDAVYRPFAQQPFVAPFLVVRTAGDPLALAPALRHEIASADAGIVTAAVTTLDQLVTDAAAQPNFRTVLLASLAGLALTIAAIGLYSVVAYAVSQRTKEIGIRIALGARSRDVLGLVIGDGLVIAVVGIAAGVTCAWWLTRVLAGLLYGISPTDPLSFLLASAGLFFLTLLSSYVPARRAARIDPIRALRCE